MLGLADQVDGHGGRIGGVVGHHHRLRGPGHHVDADPPEQVTLGLGDQRVAGSDDHVGGPAGEQPVGQRPHALDAAQAEDASRPGYRRGMQDGLSLIHI